MLPKHIGHEKRSARLVRTLSQRLHVPVDCRELAEVVAYEHGNIRRSGEFGAAALVRLLERCDAWRRPQRFADALLACECDARRRLGREEAPYPQHERLLSALALATSIDTAGVAHRAAEAGRTGPAIGEAIQRARVEAVATGLGA